MPMPVCVVSRVWVIPGYIANYCPGGRAQDGHHHLDVGHRDSFMSSQNNSSLSHKRPSDGKLSYLSFGPE